MPISDEINTIKNEIKNNQVTELNLTDKEIDNEGAAALAEGLKTNTSLTTLNLGENQIGHDGAKSIAEALKTNSSLTKLYLGRNQIGAKGAKALAGSLKINPTLATLFLGRNQIGDEGATALAEALKANPSLTTLNLRNNKIGDEGAKSIAEALKANFSLTDLTLSGNQISDEGGKALAEALKTNSSLTSLYLSHNQIGDEGAKSIAEALKANPSLTTLNLVENQIGVEGAKAIAEALEYNYAIIEYVLDFPSDTIDKLVARNRSYQASANTFLNRCRSNLEGLNLNGILEGLTPVIADFDVNFVQHPERIPPTFLVQLKALHEDIQAYQKNDVRGVWQHLGRTTFVTNELRLVAETMVRDRLLTLSDGAIPHEALVYGLWLSRATLNNHKTGDDFSFQLKWVINSYYFPETGQMPEFQLFTYDQLRQMAKACLNEEKIEERNMLSQLLQDASYDPDRAKELVYHLQINNKLDRNDSIVVLEDIIFQDKETKTLPILTHQSLLASTRGTLDADKAASSASTLLERVNEAKDELNKKYSSPEAEATATTTPRFR